MSLFLLSSFEDHCYLEAPEKVQELQNLILDMLLFYQSQMFPEDSLRIAHFLLITADIRNVKLQLQAVGDLDLTWVENIGIKLPQIFHEVWEDWIKTDLIIQLFHYSFI